MVLVRALQHSDRLVEQPPPRPLLLLAVPPAIAPLLTEEPLHDALDILAEIGPDRNDPAVDAWLHLAREEGLAVVLPSAVLADQAHGMARFCAGRIKTECPQQCHAPGSRGPLGEEGPSPLA